MRIIFIICLMITALALPARAEDAPAAAKKSVVLFREDAGLTKAAALLRAAKYAEALDTLDDVLKRHPGNADALTYMGYAYMQMEDFEKATQMIDNALISNPQHLGANAYRADLYLKNGDTARALEQLQVMRTVCGDMD